MIYIQRDRVDENGIEIRPSDEWFERANSATRTAIGEQENHIPDNNIYGSDEVKAALEKLFHDKCAYCESKISGILDWNVEHFRPKGRVAERSDHPGYYWLTYTWDNLYPSCIYCNQRRKDKPRWGDLTYADTEGKMDQFPLEDENTRALSDNDDLAREKNLLLDPCIDDPEEFLCYDVTGQILPLEDNERSKSTIDICHLSQRRLRDRRLEIINAMIECLKFKNKFVNNQEVLLEFESKVLNSMLSDNCPHAGVARYVYNNQEEFLNL